MTVTPDYFHCITDARFRSSVYEPEADTFLFLEALDKDAGLLRAMKPRRCVEIGCGSGTVISHLQLVLCGAAAAAGGEDAGALAAGSQTCSEPWPEYHAVDLNPVALEATGMTWRKTLDSLGADAGPSLHLHHGDLFSPFQQQEEKVNLAGGPYEFDIILFNPPYVPTTMEELMRAESEENFITAAWCGGPRGRVVVDRFVSHLPQYLSAHGVCYIIAISVNDIPELMETIRGVFIAKAPPGETVPIAVEVVTERYTGEYLKVIRVMRK
ncbi:N5-glutamine methyltransferase MTQ2 [Trypanosoma grayi]|uniref:N5-glutamine methyltransferase MTQ2 n=1 Tax=Trypanosoma grayi TaxID=71804 RepID=UPI0004F42C1A|nr:N5-glutamine methyltransferase MTQ2 [Trypanosoma grayi]KEG12968.1 N5-glutamine methyltransferase MTQ2 [Trypanosoma grayi]